MTNARPVIEHFDSDGGTTHTVVREPKRIKEVKNNTDEVDERNPFGRPDQGITDYDDLINPPAAAASAAQPAAASASDQDHAQDNAQDDDVNDKEDRDPNMSDIPNDVWRSVSESVRMACLPGSRLPGTVLSTAREVLEDDDQRLITAAGHTANDTAGPVANHTVAGSADEPLQEISGAIIEHVHTSSFVYNCFRLVQARQMLNIAPDVQILNSHQLSQIHRDLVFNLHQDRNLDKSPEWQKAADEKIHQITMACNLLRKHYYNTRQTSYRILDPDSRQSNLHDGAPAGDLDVEDAVELQPAVEPPTLIFTAPQLIAWCNQKNLNFCKLLYSRWRQPENEAGEWVWGSWQQLPAWLQTAGVTECALAIIRASAWSAIQQDAAPRPGLGGHYGTVVDASAAEGGSAAVASAVDAGAAEEGRPSVHDMTVLEMKEELATLGSNAVDCFERSEIELKLCDSVSVVYYRT
jgi:hypothetical protein